MEVIAKLIPCYHFFSDHSVYYSKLTFISYKWQYHSKGGECPTFIFIPKVVPPIGFLTGHTLYPHEPGNLMPSHPCSVISLPNSSQMTYQWRRSRGGAIPQYKMPGREYVS